MADIYDLTDTWNDAGVAFTSVKMDVTNTASAAGSKLLDLQVGGVSKLSVDAAGTLVSAENVNGASPTEMGYLSGVTSGIQAQIDAAGGGAFGADANTLITASTPIVLDEAIGDETALTLSYTTNKATSGNDTGLLIDFTDTDSPGTSYPFKIDVNGTTKLQLDYTGGNYLSNAGSFGASYLELYTGPAGGVGRVGANRNIILAPTTGDGVHLGSQTVLSWSSGIPTFVSGEIKIGRDAANTIYQRNGFNPQTFNIYNTHEWVGVFNWERAHIGWNDTADTFVIGTEAAGTGIGRGIHVEPGGSLKLKAATGNPLTLGANGSYTWQLTTGHVFGPTGNNVRDLASASLRIKRAYLGTTLDIAQGTLT
ncbi:MAG: hypothetical protein P1U82_12835, partial [Verrucomicrobiales bacterium]|nr:hypothetical protein [Verrucomicrobiales bacterium]